MRRGILVCLSLFISLLSHSLALSSLLFLALACAPAVENDDAGVSPDDAGSHDAGSHDAGSHDAGDAPDGGSDDAGADPCADADPVLGTLALAEGYSVVESAAISTSLAAIEVVSDGGGGAVLYGVDVAAGTVVELGSWPLADDASPSPLFEVVPADVEEWYLSWFLASDGVRVAAGYTGAFDPVTFVASGALAIYDTTPGAAEPLRHVDANNNYAADFVADALVVNAASLGDVSGDTALYAQPDEPTLLATYTDPATTYGGPVIATSSGSLVVGGYYGGAQHFALLSASDIADALAGEPIALADAEEIVAAPSLAAARFGDDLAYVHGDFFTPFEAVRRVSLADGATRTPTDVLTFVDECTSVDLLTDIEDDLLVGVSDAAGRRLVRVRAGE